MTTNLLKEIGTKYRTDKVDHGYMDVYYDYFSPFRYKDINILEIGVYNGSSILTWREFFPKAHIVGLDIEDKKSLFKQIPGHNSFYMADQGDRKQLMFMCEMVMSQTGKGFDIIIDDGSHFQHDLMVSFGCMFPYVNSGGLYILEDMATPSRLAQSPVRGNWWGSPDENHQNSHLPGLSANAGAMKQWLPNGKKDLYHCARTTMERLESTSIMTNAFLTDQECQYISDNVDNVKVYMGSTPPIKGPSSIAIVTKKQNDRREEGIVL